MIRFKHLTKPSVASTSYALVTVDISPFNEFLCVDLAESVSNKLLVRTSLLIQWSATVLSQTVTHRLPLPDRLKVYFSHCPQCSRPCGLTQVLVLGNVRFFFANLDFAANKPRLIITAHPAADIPDPLASPNVCSSTPVIGFLNLGRLRDTSTLLRRFLTNLNQSVAILSDNFSSHDK